MLKPPPFKKIRVSNFEGSLPFTQCFETGYETGTNPPSFALQDKFRGVRSWLSIL